MALFLQIKDGNRGAFKALFDQYYTELLRVAIYYVRDVEVAKDVVQEIYVRLWENRTNLHEVGNERGYLQHGVRNRCLNYLEHVAVRDRYKRLYMEVHGEVEEVEELLDGVEVLLKQLPEKRRRILELSVLESKSYKEIAQEQGIEVSTVKDHIRKAYAFLRAHFTKDILRSVLFFWLRISKIKN